MKLKLSDVAIAKKMSEVFIKVRKVVVAAVVAICLPLDSARQDE